MIRIAVNPSPDQGLFRGEVGNETDEYVIYKDLQARPCQNVSQPLPNISMTLAIPKLNKSALTFGIKCTVGGVVNR